MKFQSLCVKIATIAFIIAFKVSEIKSNLEIPSEHSENATDLEVLPFGIEDYEYSDDKYMDLTASTNARKSNGSKDNHYYLYTKNNPNNPDELFINDVDALTNSNFIQQAEVKILIHGFSATYQTSQFPGPVFASYLNPQTRDLNIILVDWSILAKGPHYLIATANVAIAAEEIAKFVKFLVDQKVTTLGQVHLIGHSLGAHVAGDTGYYINQTMGQKVSRVTGLDPAKPLFELKYERGRIDPSDAEFVDIIHTTGLTVGLLRSLGHADFYPNGGILQPGCCGNLNCNHGRSADYFAESILYPLGFKACKCFGNILSGFSSCRINGTDLTAYMGEFLSTSARGIYYLETNDKPLYGKG